MTPNICSARRTVTLSNVLGLHLRPASKFVEFAKTFQSDIRVGCKGTMANGKSILSLLSLAAECGTMLALEARGDDAQDAVETLAELVAARFHDSDEPATKSA